MASGKTIECRLDGWDVENGVLETWWQLIGLAEASKTTYNRRRLLEGTPCCHICHESSCLQASTCSRHRLGKSLHPPFVRDSRLLLCIGLKTTAGCRPSLDQPTASRPSYHTLGEKLKPTQESDQASWSAEALTATAVVLHSRSSSHESPRSNQKPGSHRVFPGPVIMIACCCWIC